MRRFTVAKLVPLLDLMASLVIFFHVELGFAATPAVIVTEQTRSSFRIPRTNCFVGTLL